MTKLVIGFILLMIGPDGPEDRARRVGGKLAGGLAGMRHAPC